VNRDELAAAQRADIAEQLKSGSLAHLFGVEPAASVSREVAPEPEPSPTPSEAPAAIIPPPLLSLPLPVAPAPLPAPEPEPPTAEQVWDRLVDEAPFMSDEDVESASRLIRAADKLVEDGPASEMSRSLIRSATKLLDEHRFVLRPPEQQ